MAGGYQRVPRSDGDVRRRQPVEEAVSGLWRSQTMSLVSIHFERDNCRRDLLRLGKLGCLQFRDEGSKTSRVHLEDVRRAENLERQLRYFNEQKAQWKPTGGWRAAAPAAPAGGSPQWHDNPLALEQIDEVASSAEAALRGHVAAFEQLRKEWLEWYVRWSVLRNPLVQQLSLEPRSAGAGDEQQIVGGALPYDRAQAFVRLHQRRSRGYAKLCPDPIEDGPDSVRPMHMPQDVEGTDRDVLPPRLGYRERLELLDDILYNPAVGATQKLAVFVSVSFQPGLGRRMASLFGSMDFVIALDSMSPARAGPNCRMPAGSDQLGGCIREAKQRLEEISAGLISTKAQIREDIRRVLPHMTEWAQTICVHKAVAHTMGMCRNHSLGHGEDMWGSAWIPTSRVAEVSDEMRKYGAWTGVIQEQTSVPSDETRPTYFSSSKGKILSTFQGIVDSYGTPRYKEINPAVFTIVTFPWLFGIMYGDIGHGLIITAASALMIVFEKKLGGVTSELFGMVFGARYLLLLMGLFATYLGFLYNDFFGLMLDYGWFTQSRYAWPADWQERKVIHVGEYAGDSGPMVFGMDPAWVLTDNKIDFFNSFKEKNAILCGVAQMMLGLVLSILNHKYFGDRKGGDYKHIWFGCVPEIVFLSCTFGYLCVLIVAKWANPFPTQPSLLSTLTNFFLSPGHGSNLSPPLGPFYEGQAGVEVTLLLIAFIAVPFMLVPIPYIEWQHQKKSGAGRRRNSAQSALVEMDEVRVSSPVAQRRGHASPDAVQEGGPPPSDDEPQAPAADMQEVVIKQIIHTIEFVLGSVSNTASYLRLWALSLAHAQLSEVFWDFTMKYGLQMQDGGVGGSIALYIIYPVWFTATVAVLVGMEALSAFLHALRLHWVEFQNKFYWADGVAFQPLDFDALLAEGGLPPMPR
eukprot:TRINITY_DN16664_c0_g2_i1.p1 TRINITY_DN16664_c0_g2~~TRINITY_DN16664_c0_g2_i1.p1  ORF type:complete len:914 (+),score=294.16 TRINITY_DN16664_c0_g2_i1:80-2821(+)